MAASGLIIQGTVDCHHAAKRTNTEQTASVITQWVGNSVSIIVSCRGSDANWRLWNILWNLIGGGIDVWYRADVSVELYCGWCDKNWHPIMTSDVNVVRVGSERYRASIGSEAGQTRVNIRLDATLSLAD